MQNLTMYLTSAVEKRIFQRLNFQVHFLCRFLLLKETQQSSNFRFSLNLFGGFITRVHSLLYEDDI